MENEKKSIKKHITDFLYNNKFFFITIIVLLIFRIFFISINVVVGESMEPTLHDDDVVIVDTKFYKYTKLDRNDIIVFEQDLENIEGTLEEKYLVKRIIGLPGESVAIKSGKLYINDKEVDNDITAEFDLITNDFESTVIPEGKYFVLGDNRTVSLDSRSSYIGFVDEESINGHVVFREKPFKDFGFVK